MTIHLTIESAGPGSTIQDGGRTGLLRFGVTPAGPMDALAFATANRVLGNTPDAAAIEIGLGGIALTTDTPVTLAFAGGDFLWHRAERALPAAARVKLRPGETLRARPGPWGAFAYCAVPGGIDVAPVMGSRSTHARSRLGGLGGRGLKSGDTLPCGISSDLDDVEIVAPWLARDTAPIRLVLGPQDDHFDAAAIATLLGSDYTLTAAADRMAYKFDGAEIAHAKDFNIVSDGVALGAVQIAGDGKPMVLMADRQPTGGYPKIAHVCRADIGRLAQLRPGETCRFASITVDDARRALLRLEDWLADAHEHVVALRLVPSAASLARENLIGGAIDGTDPGT